jgi:hypothetical protein
METISVKAVATHTNYAYSTGTITIAATGGKKPYKYSIDAGETFQYDNYFKDLYGKSYDIVVKDKNGDISLPTTVVVEKVLSELQTRFIDNLIECFGRKRSACAMTIISKENEKKKSLTIAECDKWYRDIDFAEHISAALGKANEYRLEHYENLMDKAATGGVPIYAWEKVYDDNGNVIMITDEYGELTPKVRRVQIGETLINDRLLMFGLTAMKPDVYGKTNNNGKLDKSQEIRISVVDISDALAENE